MIVLTKKTSNSPFWGEFSMKLVNFGQILHKISGFRKM